MSDTFDPYREWLSITDSERPPNHYSLLGVDLFDENADRIWNSSMVRMGHVLEFDPGPNCHDARRIFDELETARDCLCDPEAKRAYDAWLRGQLGGFEVDEVTGSTRVEEEPELAHAGSSPAERPTEANSAVRTEAKLPPKSDPRAPTSDPRSSGKPPATSPGPPHREGSTARHAHDRSTVQRLAGKREFSFEQRRAVLTGLLLAGMAAFGWLGFNWLLGEAGEVDPVPELIQDLQDADPQTRIAAARSLKDLGGRAGAAVPQLLLILRDDRDAQVRLAAAQAMEACISAMPTVTPELKRLQTFESDPTVHHVLQTILDNNP